MRKCTVCNKQKPLSEFYQRKSRKCGVTSMCKNCDKARHATYYEKNKQRLQLYDQERRLLCAYGITIEEKKQLIKTQHGRCLICNNLLGGEAACCVDHDHKTGKIRGILCDKCNKGIGLFQDNPALCDMASIYLRKHING